MPQYFKFSASNPLSVRTKVAFLHRVAVWELLCDAPLQMRSPMLTTSFFAQTRQVLDSTFLEASLENATKGHLLLEYVRFDPAPGVQVEPVDVRDALTTSTAAAGPIGYASSW